MTGEIPFNPITPPETPETPEEPEAEIPGKGPFYLAGEINYSNGSGAYNKMISLKVRQGAPAIFRNARESGYTESVVISSDEFKEIVGDNDTTTKPVHIGDIFFFNRDRRAVEPSEVYNKDRHILMTRQAWLNENPG